MTMVRLDEQVLAAGQIAPGDMTAIAEAGVTMIVNNRPDGEEAGQPRAAEIEAAAQAAGIDYRHIPVAGGFAPHQVHEMVKAFEEAEGRVLAFCKSGTRSTYLWALARHSLGAEGRLLVAQAAKAGYDLTPLLPRLRDSAERG
jgi:uncharacterized protein (TIGR01244 family)